MSACQLVCHNIQTGPGIERPEEAFGSIHPDYRQAGDPDVRHRGPLRAEQNIGVFRRAPQGRLSTSFGRTPQLSTINPRIAISGMMRAGAAAAGWRYS
jgi:hypothetical protein